MTTDTSNKRPWTVLIVDDDPDVRLVLQRTLERRIPNLRTIHAINGNDGLQQLAHTEVDLIVSDQRMPEMEGVEFLELAAKLVPEVPRVLLTGFADVEVAVRAVNGGRISAFFQKPAPLDQLVSEVLRLLQNRESTIHRHQAFAKSIDLVRRSSAPFTGSLEGDEP